MTAKRILLTVLIVCIVSAAVGFAFSEQKKNKTTDDFSLMLNQKEQTNSENIFNLQNNYKGEGYGLKNEAIKHISLQFGEVRNFSEGLAAVLIGEKWGFINLENDLVIPAIYQDAQNFEQGKANVKFEGKWFFINKLGQQIKNKEMI